MTPLLAPRPRPDRSFERLYRRHVGDVYRYALAMLRNAADAEDVTQTTFLNAYRAFERGERPRAPQNWLITIAHNVCRQRFRQTQRRVQEVMLNENVADELVSDDDAPTIQDVQRALGHLAFNQRSALVMRELEGRSYAEIAQALEVSTSAVETLLFRARRALREQLEGGLTCGEAELAISRQLDGRLERSDRGTLRAHLRECKDCASLARRQRAQRAAIKALGVVPLPTSLSSLSSLFGGGAAAVGGGVAAKAAAVAAAGLLVGAVGYEGTQRVTREPAEARSKTTVAPVSRASVPGQLAALVRVATPGTGRQFGPAKRLERERVQKAESKKAAKVEAAGRVKARGKSAVRARIKPAPRSKSGGRPDPPGRGQPGAGRPGATSATAAASQGVERGGGPRTTLREGHNGQRAQKATPSRPAKKATREPHPSKGNGNGGSEGSKGNQHEKKDKGQAGNVTGGQPAATKKLELDDGLRPPEPARKEEKSPPGQEDRKPEPKDGTVGATTPPTAPHEPPGQSDDHGKDKDKGKK